MKSTRRVSFPRVSILVPTLALSFLFLGSGAPLEAATGRILNVDFGVGTSSAKVGLAATGQSAHDFWNLYSRDDGRGGFRTLGSVENLVWADGGESRIGLTVTNAPGAWNSGSADAMMSVFLYPFNGGEIAIGITNLPPAVYQLHVYGHGVGPHEVGRFVVQAGEHQLGPLSTRDGNDWNPPGWQEGMQYVVFRDIRVEAGATLVLRALAAYTGLAVINGIQLVQGDVPAVTFAPFEREFTNATSVVLSNNLGTGRIRFTLDGSDVTSDSPIYDAPIPLDHGATINAGVYFNEFPISASYSARYDRIYALDDGVPNEWREQHFGAGYRTDPRVGAAADPDHDGANNLQEYKGGTDPLDPLSGFQLRIKAVPAIAWNTVPGKAYRLWRKPSLNAPEWTVVVDRYVATAETSTLVDIEVGDRTSFYAIEPVP